jgi:uncharacterized 2Fe-2S/4Fe-4S cluster protein (DUF4445 family)
MTHTIKILPGGRVIKAASGTILADALHEAGFPISLYCGKMGLCGKCFVEIIRGGLPHPDSQEKIILERLLLANNYRLSCRYRISGSLMIRIPEESLLPQMPVLTQGVRRTIAIDPPAKKVALSLPRPDLSTPLALTDLIQSRFPGVSLKISAEALRVQAAFPEGPDMKMTAVVYKGSELTDIEPQDTTGRNFGLAVDLGTTTLVVELVDLNSGKTLDTEVGLNAQNRYGADVVSRIAAAYADPEKSRELKEVVVGALNEMIGRLLEKRHIPSNFVYEAVIAGNTAMNHLFLGLPVQTLAVSPYYALFSLLPALPAASTGLAINPRGKVYLAPNIKSFVGGDIAAGLAAADLASLPGNVLFIDLGTNGEIVLKKDRRFTATSTAAGPAFEGMNISCGMLALPGAIYKAEFRNKLHVRTISGRPALGVCGSGLIDLVAVFLKNGLISSQGQIQGPGKRIRVTKDIFLNQKDIRQMQLAAAAVKTGIRLLLAKSRLVSRDLDAVYVAGALGSTLNLYNSMALGLLPKCPEKKIFFIGNSSLAGARALLLSRAERSRCEKLVRRVRHLSLAEDALFQKTFIDALEFGAWS